MLNIATIHKETQNTKEITFLKTPINKKML